MSNDPTKAADRWNIGRSNLLYNLVYLLVALTVSYLFNLTFLAAVLWCLPLIPAWFLVQKYLRRKVSVANTSFWLIYPLLPLVVIWVIWKVFLFKGRHQA